MERSSLLPEGHKHLVFPGSLRVLQPHLPTDTITPLALRCLQMSWSQKTSWENVGVKTVYQAYKEWGPQWVDMNWEVGEVPSWPLDWGALIPFTPRKEYGKADRRGGVREVKDSHKRVCLKWWSLASSSPDGKGKGEGGKNKTSGYLTVCIPESHTL